MVYGFVAAAAKVMPLTSVFAEMDTLVVFERGNVAVSTDPLGTVVGVQFVAVFQSPELGLRFHVGAAGLAGLDAKHQDKRAENRSDVREWCFHGEPENDQGRPAMPSFYFAYLVNSCQFAPRIVEKESDQSLILYLALNERRRSAKKCCLKVDRA